MLDGIIPTKLLLQKYHMDVYTDLARAVRESNLEMLENAIKASRSQFVKMDTILLVERLKTVIYRQVWSPNLL